MSVWGNILDRGAGETIRKENFTVIYYDNDTSKKPIVTVEEKEYEDFRYMVLTTGDYPILDIRTKTGISVFSGYNRVILKFEDGVRFELDRIVVNGETKFLYEFNKEGDYNHSKPSEGGQKYSLQKLEIYAEMFIDKIIECEKKLIDYKD